MIFTLALICPFELRSDQKSKLRWHSYFITAVFYFIFPPHYLLLCVHYLVRVVSSQFSFIPIVKKSVFLKFASFLLFSNPNISLLDHHRKYPIKRALNIIFIVSWGIICSNYTLKVFINHQINHYSTWWCLHPNKTILLYFFTFLTV